MAGKGNFENKDDYWISVVNDIEIKRSGESSITPGDPASSTK